MPEWLATVSDRILQPIQLTGTDVKEDEKTVTK